MADISQHDTSVVFSALSREDSPEDCFLTDMSPSLPENKVLTEPLSQHKLLTTIPNSLQLVVLTRLVTSLPRISLSIPSYLFCLGPKNDVWSQGTVFALHQAIQRVSK